MPEEENIALLLMCKKNNVWRELAFLPRLSRAVMPEIGSSMHLRGLFGRTASFTTHLGASSKTYGGGLQLNRRTLYVLRYSTISTA